MNSMWQRIAMIVVSAALVSCAASNGSSSRTPSASAPSGSGPILVVQDQIPFSTDAEVRKVIRSDCQLPNKLSHFIKEYASGYSSQILSDAAKAPKGAQLLTVEIYNVTGGGGGAWSGGKSVSIRGTLRQDGKIIGGFKGRRFSGGGMFGAYKGTCAIMGRCVKTLGRDVAEWLRHPSNNAMLGDI